MRTAATAIALGLSTAVAAQPRAERRVFAHVQFLRGQLLSELRGGGPTARRAVAEDLATDMRGNPCLPLARAFARIREVEPDEAFVLRMSLMPFAMPEIIDLEEYTQLHFTVLLPYKVAIPGEVEIRVRVLDTRDEVRWRGNIRDETDEYGLMNYQCRTSIDVAGWPEGAYRVEARAWIDGKAPRATDFDSSATFFVRRGFPSTVRRLVAEAGRLGGAAPRADEIALKGAMSQVGRVYGAPPFQTGWEPPPWRTRALCEVEWAERMLLNLAWKRDLLAGLRGWVGIAVETGEDEAGVVRVRLRDGAPADAPLVLFVPGAPCWDHEWQRPTSPESAPPGWVCDALEAEGFDRAGVFHVAVMASPGRYASAAGAVTSIVAELRRRFGVRGPTVLIGEREGALAVCRAIAAKPDIAAGVVLACGGGLGPDEVDLLRGLHVLAIPGHQHVGNANLLRSVASLRERGAEHLRMLDAKDTPWPLAVSVHARAIERLVRDVVTARRGR